MSRTLMLSDALYARLEAAARRRGLSSIEQLLEEWHTAENELSARQEVVDQIDVLREQLLAA